MEKEQDRSKEKKEPHAYPRELCKEIAVGAEEDTRASDVIAIETVDLKNRVQCSFFVREDRN